MAYFTFAEARFQPDTLLPVRDYPSPSATTSFTWILQLRPVPEIKVTELRFSCRNSFLHVDHVKCNCVPFARKGMSAMFSETDIRWIIRGRIRLRICLSYQSKYVQTYRMQISKESIQNIRNKVFISIFRVWHVFLYFFLFFSCVQ